MKELDGAGRFDNRMGKSFVVSVPVEAMVVAATATWPPGRGLVYLPPEWSCSILLPQSVDSLP